MSPVSFDVGHHYLGKSMFRTLFRSLSILLFAAVFSTGANAADLSAKFRPIAQLPKSSTDSAASVANIVNITKHPSLSGSSYNGWLTVADSRGPVYLVNTSSYKQGVT